MGGDDPNQGDSKKGKRKHGEDYTPTRYFPTQSIAIKRFVEAETLAIMEIMEDVVERGWLNFFQLRGEVYDEAMCLGSH